MRYVSSRCSMISPVGARSGSMPSSATQRRERLPSSYLRRANRLVACNQDRDEKHQAWIHLPIILLGLGAGTAAPGVAPLLETLLWPALAALLYVTFMQIPLATTAFLIVIALPLTLAWLTERGITLPATRRSDRQVGCSAGAAAGARAVSRRGIPGRNGAPLAVAAPADAGRVPRIPARRCLVPRWLMPTPSAPSR